MQHGLNVIASDNRLRDVTQLDREAALLSSKYSRRVRMLLSRGRTTAPTAIEELRELGGKSGAAERKLYLALNRERDRISLALKATGAVSLIQPLNVACIEAARIIRLRTGNLATEVPGLDQAAVCRGDIVTDRLVYRYCRAVTAEDDLEQTRALRDIQIQLACLSTRQVRTFETRLVAAVEWAEKSGIAAAGNDKQAQAIRDSFRQMLAPLVFAVADASRLFRNYDRPGVIWLLTHRDMLAKAALREGTISNRIGLLFANRYSGQLRRMRAHCLPGSPKLFDDRRGGRTCNPLGALFESVALPCDSTQWVPSAADGVTSFKCDAA
ncbi:MAG: hypothetical protein WCE79_08895, partial [Xanthobacteraceae bacterium]